jgi:negative regulator of flagellin synthesis FlgM
MKINQINQISRVGAAYNAYQKNSDKPKKASDDKKVQYDQVELSIEAQQQLQLGKDEKIAKLKDQIANGTYKVDSEKVAERLLAFWNSGASLDE